MARVAEARSKSRLRGFTIATALREGARAHGARLRGIRWPIRATCDARLPRICVPDRGNPGDSAGAAQCARLMLRPVVDSEGGFGVMKTMVAGLGALVLGLGLSSTALAQGAAPAPSPPPAQVQEAPPPPAPPAPQASWVRAYPTGQWVYTSDYGWVWVPAGGATTMVDGVPATLSCTRQHTGGPGTCRLGASARTTTGHGWSTPGAPWAGVAVGSRTRASPFALACRASGSACASAATTAAAGITGSSRLVVLAKTPRRRRGKWPQGAPAPCGPGSFGRFLSVA